MLAVLLALAQLLALAVAQAPAGDPGSTDCPCIDPFNRSQFADLECALTRTSDGSNDCFPVTYGAEGCRKYDQHPSNTVQRHRAQS